MKIGIDSRSINLHSGTGIGTYTKNLVKEVLTLDKKNKYTLIWTGEMIEEFNNLNPDFIMSSGKHGRFFENIYIPEILNSKDIDLYHIPQNGMGLPFGYENLNYVVTIHDLIPYIMPQTVGPGYLKRFLRDMPNIIENSSGILTVSEFSKRDILRFFKGYPEDKIFVTPLATSEIYKPLPKDTSLKIVQDKFNFNSSYLLYVGGFSSRKNVKGLIDAFLKAKGSFSKKMKLLIVGSLKDDGLNLFKYVESLNIDDIIFTGYIEDSVLPTLYSGATAFVYPSYYEGFGLPPLEAMSCKTPVITSNVTSIPEVTKDSSILIEPSDILNLSSSIFEIVENESLRLDIAEKGYKRSLQFSWRQTANKTLSAYSEIYKSLDII